MIKIPGTPEGEGAIEQAIYEGINVNVTLLFSVESYQAIAEAYIRGLERRHAEGLSLDVNSVPLLRLARRHQRRPQARGARAHRPRGDRGAGQCARRVRALQGALLRSRWDALRDAGAAVQRPLWASTGAKNPHYPDTMYVDGLVAPHTVNTMPMATLLAAADHSEMTGPTAEEDPTPRSRRSQEAGIDMRQVTEELLVDGVKQFEDAMNELLAGIEERRAAVATGRPPTIQSACRPSSRSRSPSASSRPSANPSPSASGSATRRCGAAPASPRSRTASAG